MTTSRGFASFGLIITLIIIIALAGAGWWYLQSAPGASSTAEPDTSANAPTAGQANTSADTQASIEVAGNPSYTPVALADVVSHASASVNNYVSTSGTVAGVTPPHFLLITDGEGHYVLVPVAHVAEDVFGPVYANLKKGDRVEVTGVADSTDSATIASEFGISVTAAQVGMLNLTSIKKD